MRQDDFIKMTGEVSIQCVAEDGRVLYEYTDNNLVVTGGRVNAVRLMGGSASGYEITKIGVGTSNTAAAITDTGLTGSFVKLLNTDSTVNTYTTTPPVSVTFYFKINTSEANGMTIFELGLFNDNGDLMARKVLDSSIAKNSSFAITGSWRLNLL